MGYPLVGDSLYGDHDKKIKQIKNNNLKKIFENINHQLLHAYYFKIYSS